MRSLELKIPPLAVVLVLAILMWLLASRAPSLQLPFSLRLTSALVLLALGQIIIISGVAAFRRAKTTVNPLKPADASSLVTGGIYRFTRNPMYLGMSLTLLGWSAYLANPLAVLFVPVFILYMNRFQIQPEERFMHSMFGDEYARYCQQVRRWI